MYITVDQLSVFFSVCWKFSHENFLCTSIIAENVLLVVAFNGVFCLSGELLPMYFGESYRWGEGGDRGDQKFKSVSFQDGVRETCSTYMK